MQAHLKWEVKRRLTLLEATVFWSGGVTTRSLIETFGISRVQASKDFRLYQTLRPNNLRYDRFLRRYVTTERFTPIFIQASVDEYLHLLKAVRQPGDGPIVTLARQLPNVALVEPAVRLIPVENLRILVQSIHRKEAVSVTYQSMSRPEPTVHQLSPHTLVFDGLRWHVRAFSKTHGDFRDFVLARIGEIEPAGKSEADRSMDRLWCREVDLLIGPHPGLSATQKRVIEVDYGMVDGVLRYPIRAALAPYFLLSMRIGRDDISRRPRDQQIVLLNRKNIQDDLHFL